MYRGAAGQAGATSMRKAQERRGLHDETGDSETITGQAQYEAKNEQRRSNKHNVTDDKDEEGFLSDNTVEAHKMALKALEREQQKYTRPRHCDCCGVLLTEDNNKCGYELCDECNERLEQSMERGRNEQKRSEFYIGKH